MFAQTLSAETQVFIVVSLSYYNLITSMEIAITTILKTLGCCVLIVILKRLLFVSKEKHTRKQSELCAFVNDTHSSGRVRTYNEFPRQIQSLVSCQLDDAGVFRLKSGVLPIRPRRNDPSPQGET